MENPLELSAPNDPVERVHAFALDLAYGASKGVWSSHITVLFSAGGVGWRIWPLTDDGGNKFDIFLANKWASTPPSVHLMLSFEYFNQYDHDQYLLTPKAFGLLEHPPTTISAFISYKRESSSAFALLVEAKLKIRDNGIKIFVDKLIKPGDDWAENIQEKIKQSRYFICLLAPDTYTGSEWVRKELDWAYDAGCEIISVFHSGAVLNDRYPVWLGKKQVIKVDFETAKHYESALDEILVGLGYSTY